MKKIRINGRKKKLVQNTFSVCASGLCKTKNTPSRDTRGMSGLFFKNLGATAVVYKVVVANHSAAEACRAHIFKMRVNVA